MFGRPLPPSKTTLEFRFSPAAIKARDSAVDLDKNGDGKLSSQERAKAKEKYDDAARAVMTFFAHKWTKGGSAEKMISRVMNMRLPCETFYNKQDCNLAKYQTDLTVLAGLRDLIEGVKKFLCAFFPPPHSHPALRLRRCSRLASAPQRQRTK